MSCAICLDTIESQLIKTHCGHSFHPECIGLWLNYKMTCPLCRNVLDISTDKPLVFFMQIAQFEWFVRSLYEYTRHMVGYDTVVTAIYLCSIILQRYCSSRTSIIPIASASYELFIGYITSILSNLHSLVMILWFISSQRYHTDININYIYPSINYNTPDSGVPMLP